MSNGEGETKWNKGDRRRRREKEGARQAPILCVCLHDKWFREVSHLQRLRRCGSLLTGALVRRDVSQSLASPQRLQVGHRGQILYYLVTGGCIICISTKAGPSSGFVAITQCFSSLLSGPSPILSEPLSHHYIWWLCRCPHLRWLCWQIIPLRCEPMVY